MQSPQKANLGAAAHDEGDLGRAKALPKRSLETHGNLGTGGAPPAYSRHCRNPRASDGNPNGMLGAARALRERISTPVPPCERASHQANVAAVRTELGEEAFAAALAQGKTLTLAQILADDRQATLPATPPTGLTAREVEVLGLVPSGLNDPQVAEQLFISRRTVYAHLRSIYQKLGVTARTAATRFALENDLA